MDEKTWAAVQARLRTNKGGGSTPYGGTTNGASLLKDLARCGVCGSALLHHYTAKADRKYSYYVCTRHQKEGAGACPGSRVPASKLDAFVLDRIRSIGREPEVLEATISADRSDREARRPELVAEARRLAVEKERVKTERANLVDAVAKGNGDASSTLMRRIADLDEEIERTGRGLEVVNGDLAALELGVLDADDLRDALQDLDPVWGELFPNERARVLSLLVEEVRFNAPAEEVEITFRPGGPKALRNGIPGESL